MSLILEALKKIEKDKTGDAQNADIAAAILQPGHRAKPRRVLLISVFGAAVLLVAAGAGLSYFLSAKGKPQNPPVIIQPDPLPKAVVSPPAVARPVTAKPEKRAEVKPMPAPEKRAEAPTAPRSPVPSVASPPAAAKPPAGREIRKADKIQPDTLPARKASVSRPSRGESVEDSAPADIPRISIGGIIWSEETGARRALVNGSAVKEGDIVDGVRVERIMQERIRFSKNGKKFELTFR